MNRTACRERLTELLQTQNERISAANDYLLDIRQAIAENRLDQLQQSLGNPDLALEDIEQLEKQRNQILVECGFDGDRDGFAHCIDWCDDDQRQVAQLYQQLVQGLVQLQHSIQINSLLVSKGKDRVRRSIGILTGLGTGTAGKTYNRDGKARDSMGRRDIAIA